MKRFDALRRSQIIIRLYAIERELLRANDRGLLHVKPGSSTDRRLRTERSELLEALQKRDAELIAKWNASGYPAIS